VAIVLEEADESLYWLELLEELGVVAPARTAPLGKEADELVAMLVATLRSSREGADR
jgi:four helix bundle protein